MPFDGTHFDVVDRCDFNGAGGFQCAETTGVSGQCGMGLLQCSTPADPADPADPGGAVVEVAGLGVYAAAGVGGCLFVVCLVVAAVRCSSQRQQRGRGAYALANQDVTTPNDAFDMDDGSSSS